MDQARTIIIPVFVLMLSLQLSGMTCLNDFLFINSTPQLLLGPFGATTETALDNDQCPCHVLFSQSDQMSLEADKLSVIIVPSAPSTPVSTRNHSFFHPPTLLSHAKANARG